MIKASSKIWRFVKHYLYGMFAKSFNGATSAMDGFLGLAGGAALTEQITKPNWQAGAAIFGAAFLRNAIQWCKDNPLPAQWDSSSPFDPSKPTP